MCSCCDTVQDGVVADPGNTENEVSEVSDLPAFREYSVEQLRTATSGFSIENIVS
ncbi:hypothetical protein HanRHA438_Chr05g0227511 [Helianthus annuus]|uniref:Uncharacterized protein n=1 Tax=Helianthus annuus TaxID=4232 RepID=A0A251VEH3_HELAN|nr:hypothetical protein HanXRQr2_Chr14g0666231 [Helianthus annuus]KAF5806187.1 hypothetical protein HanXRQr2_Chr05g0218401 [Helianthus annuus]KAJ0465909.1 hypothetical protein HanHA300_Chr14g0543311 [Helianthus annuus]KAJ0470832.1 hypothetical protein HanIR_Chr14g0723021 [Helianthus annuus]KAJ0487485.1 hypothetical protein HanHA89_Chr14g0590901 [Helianthus annuus]